jgi:hypothetical protein
MKKGIIGFFAISVLFTMCNKQNEKDDNIGFSILFGQTHILNIEKVLNMTVVQFPGDDLQSSDYTPATEDIQYEIAFSENGQGITIEPGAVKGIRVNDGEETLRYELNEGVFAGGRFLIWVNDDDFEVEYTIYGSGVPIIKSERGTLCTEIDLD